MRLFGLLLKTGARYDPKYCTVPISWSSSHVSKFPDKRVDPSSSARTLNLSPVQSGGGLGSADLSNSRVCKDNMAEGVPQNSGDVRDY